MEQTVEENVHANDYKTRGTKSVHRKSDKIMGNFETRKRERRNEEKEREKHNPRKAESHTASKIHYEKKKKKSENKKRRNVRKPNEERNFLMSEKKIKICGIHTKHMKEKKIE